MDIYQPRAIMEETVAKFRPTRLAIKELAGQLYFCKSITKDICAYPGSGVRWQKRIKKYGKENIKTLWVSDWYHCPHEIQEVALHFSKENQIVESETWANIKPENGLDGGMDPATAKKVNNDPEKIKKFKNKVWTEKALQTRLDNCLKSAAERKGSKWSEERKQQKFEKYIEKNKYLFPQVFSLADSGINTRQISFSLKISWDRVKYILDNRYKIIQLNKPL